MTRQERMLLLLLVLAVAGLLVLLNKFLQPDRDALIRQTQESGATNHRPDRVPGEAGP